MIVTKIVLHDAVDFGSTGGLNLAVAAIKGIGESEYAGVVIARDGYLRGCVVQLEERHPFVGAPTLVASVLAEADPEGFQALTETHSALASILEIEALAEMDNVRSRR